MSNINDTVEYLMECRQNYIRMCSLEKNRIIFEMQTGKTFISYRLDQFLKEYNSPIDLAEKLGILKKFEEKEKELSSKK